MTAAHDEPRGQVVPLRKTAPAEEILDADVVEPTEPQLLEVDRAPELAGARAVLARVTDRPLPSPSRVAASARWWGAELAKLIPWLPVLALRELRPILRGIGRTATAWARVVACADLEAAVKKAEGNEHSKAAERLAKRKSARLCISLVVGILLIAIAWWLVATRPWIAAGVVIVLAAVFDAVGRAGQKTDDRPILLPAGPITEGVPLSSLRAEIHKSLEDLGVEATIAMPMPVEHGWTIDYHARQAVEDEHLRQVERDLNIRRRGITQIVEPGQAARGQLHVMLRDPLAATVDSPDLDGLSIYQALPLGVTASSMEWTEKFLRTHFVEVGASQSGKSSGLWQIVDVLRRCPEVELDAIDLTDGPMSSACRRAFRRRGLDEQGALRVLTEAVALIKVRASELARLAEADDTPDDFDEKWQPTREEPQRTIVIDEFARVAEVEELLKLVEYVLRYGAKCAVTLGIAGQGATLADFGTSTVRAQVMLKILFACSRRDVLDLFGKDARDGGYRPDLFEPANGTDIQDAGKCFVMSANSRTPEPRRAYRLEQSEVRRRDRVLGSREATAQAVDAVEVPDSLALLERLVGDREHLPTQEVLDDDACAWATAKALASELAKYGVAPAQDRQSKARGYLRVDIERAIRDL